MADANISALPLSEKIQTKPSLSISVLREIQWRSLKHHNVGAISVKSTKTLILNEMRPRRPRSDKVGKLGKATRFLILCTLIEGVKIEAELRWELEKATRFLILCTVIYRR